MTEPPYTTDIRSNTPSGLRGLWTLLNSMAAGLTTLPAILEQATLIRQRLEWLVGANPPVSSWTGLSNYLLFNIGYGGDDRVATSASNPYNLTMMGTLYNLLNDGRRDTAQIASGPNENTVRGEIRTRGTIEATHLNNSFGMLAQIRNTTMGVNMGGQNQGLLQHLAAIREYERLLLACCTGGTVPEDPPSNGNNEPSTAFCNQNMVRNVSWNKIQETTHNGNPVTIWRPVWNFSDPILLPLTGHGGARPEPTGPAVRFPANTNATACFAWNFTGKATPVEVGRYVGGDGNAAQDWTTINTFLVPPNSTRIVGGESFDYNNCGGVDAYVAWNFVFAGTALPSNNVWLGQIINRGCAQ